MEIILGGWPAAILLTVLPLLGVALKHWSDIRWSDRYQTAVTKEIEAKDAQIETLKEVISLRESDFERMKLFTAPELERHWESTKSLYSQMIAEIEQQRDVYKQQLAHLEDKLSTEIRVVSQEVKAITAEAQVGGSSGSVVISAPATAPSSNAQNPAAK